MILSAGLTPAWQQILVFDNFRHGQVNRAREAVWAASGKVFNAALAAHHLGGPSMILAAVGGPPLEQINSQFDALGINRRWIETKAATRVCTTILDRATGTVTELVENGRSMSSEELGLFERAYAEEVGRAKVVVLIGSLPTGAAKDFYRRLLEKTSCPAVVDARCEPLLAALNCKPLVVKPNREELGRTVGQPLDDDHELVAAMKSLNERGAGWVMISQDHHPVWLSSASETFRFHPPAIDEVLNPIGCGDAMAGAIAWAIRDGRQMVDATKLAVAAACDNLAQLLPCRLDLKRVEQIAANVRVEKLAG